MTILQNAYTLTKAVEAVPQKEKMRALIRSLNIRTDSHDRSNFGYLARNVHAQFLSYLHVDQFPLKTGINPMLGAVERLQDDERQLLTDAHALLLDLNQRCILPLLEQLPNRRRAIDPYDNLDVPLGATSNSIIIDSSDIQTFAESFHAHPAFEVARHSAAVIGSEVTEEMLAGSVAAMTTAIVQAGVLNAPEELKAIALPHDRQSAPRTVLRHLGALACIRESLRTIDQLTFQALTVGRLQSLTESNIISVPEMGHTVIGMGSRVLFQGSEQAHLLEAYDLVRFKKSYPKSHTEIDQLSRVENQEVRFDIEFGETMVADVREVDENLNPFGRLLDLI